ncbi:hypothetical protein A8F94_01470 [Bacillus sp. FJAT-27225]|uniref:replicative helicase loader/inhibitor n=1 Tax=Bacillus sp. FJAT-27225 TaxID=1743144 RepID=UPI00080C292F|nr:replicative helicase loader/inhibitor [Bacillus sp. FJAT-27225]OCA90579.1 hypothetical protein A8F94_01470 [Bacillus sp. FJAT-27225]
MDKHEVTRILVLIESVYPEFTIRNETVETWFSVCRELDYHLVMKNLANHIRKSPYPPLMAEIAAFSSREDPRIGIQADEEGWVQIQHNSLLPKRMNSMPWQTEYLA